MKQLMKNIGKARLILAALLIIVNLSASATPATGPDSPATSNVTVKHLGTIGNNMYFAVELQNPSAERFSLYVKDQDGTILFHDSYNNKSFNTTFRLAKDDVKKVIFTVRMGKSSNTQSFEVNTNTRVVEEVVVTKMD